MDSLGNGTDRESRIRDALERNVGVGAAEFFEDAARMVRLEPTLSTTLHMVAHGLREIESALRHLLVHAESTSCA